MTVGVSVRCRGPRFVYTILRARSAVHDDVIARRTGSGSGSGRRLAHVLIGRGYDGAVRSSGVIVPIGGCAPCRVFKVFDVVS